jgi:hypothetical protein
MLLRDLHESFAGKGIAVYEVIAEPDHAQDLAEQEARRTLELIRLAIPGMYGASDQVRVGLVGEATSREPAGSTKRPNPSRAATVHAPLVRTGPVMTIRGRTAR